MPSWRVSSAPQETSSTRRWGIGFAQQLGEGDERAHAGEVVVGTLDGRISPHVRDECRGDRPEREPHTGADAGTADAQQRGERAGEPEPPLGWRSLEAFDQLGGAFVDLALQGLVEDHPALGSVVVGDHDERPARGGVPGAGDQVHGGATAPDEPAQYPRAVVGLIDDPRKGARGERCGAAATPPQGQRRGEHAGETQPGGGGRERSPRGLILELDLDAFDLAQASVTATRRQRARRASREGGRTEQASPRPRAAWRPTCGDRAASGSRAGGNAAGFRGSRGSTLTGSIVPHRDRWGPPQRCDRPRAGAATRSARTARPPWRGETTRDRPTASSSAAEPSSGVCTSPAPSWESSRSPAGR